MKNVVIILVGMAIFLAGFAGAGALVPRINKERREQKLMVSDEIYNLPPEMAISQAALGTFRGLAINILWIRAEELKNDGKFHEAIELGKLITRLQPHFPKVWEFVSWNQAYNISVATHTPEERWMWVKSGIDLLQRRGGGIDANPNDLPLYQQLSWIYFHKVGEYLDNMSWHYKRELADLWHSILGPPPRDLAQYEAWFEPIVLAPDRPEDLPEGPRRLVRWLIDNNYPLDRQTLAQFTVPTRVLEGQYDESRPESMQESDLVQVVPERSWPEFASEEDIAAAVAFLRRRAITSDELNMRPPFMLELARRFGPIDWRQPAAHTLYWSRLGLERVAESGRPLDSEIATHRNVLNALQTLAQSGQVVYEPVTDYISYLPMWGFWLAYDEYFQDVVRHARTGQQIEELFGGGYRNQIDFAIAAAYTFGDPPAANVLYERMQDSYRGTIYGARYTQPLDRFVYEKLAESIEEPKVARGTIVALLTYSVTNTAVYNNPREAERLLQTAQEIYNSYRQLNPIEKDPLYPEMPPFELLQINAIVNFVMGIAGPQGVAAEDIPLEYRAGVYAALSDEVKAIIYIQHRRELELEAQANGFELERVFPPPPAAVMQRVQQQMTGGSGNPLQPRQTESR